MVRKTRRSCSPCAGDDDYLDWNPNSVGPSVEWFKKWQAGIQCEEPAWCDSWYDEQETLRTQLELWKLQHPPDCRKVKVHTQGACDEGDVGD